MEKYIYSITNDFPNQVVNTTKLFSEIGESDIVTESSHISTDESEDVCNIFFEDSLSSGEEDILDSLVSVHDGVFDLNNGYQVSLGTAPKPNDIIWLDSNTSLVYFKDINRDKWLSTSKHSFEFAKKGTSKGMYLPLLGDLDGSDDFYIPGMKATIMRLFCKSNSGNNSAGFELKKNGSVLYEFAYDGVLYHIDENLDFDIEPHDEIQIYVKKGSTGVNNTICKIVIAWRYDD